MFDNVALNIFIGLVFVYLIYSLFATIFQEILARWLSLRSRMLQKAIRRMLQDQQVKTSFTPFKMGAELGLNICRFFFPYRDRNSKLLRAFYKYPSVKYLAESSWNSKPSYMEASVFSDTMIRLLAGDSTDPAANQADLVKSTLFTVKCVTAIDNQTVKIGPETLKQLQSLYINANGDMARFKANLENWFNQMMDRTTGWYKKQTSLILFLIGLLIAWQFNVDTIAIYRILAKDKVARNNMVQLAVTAGPKIKIVGDTTSEAAIKKTNELVQEDIRQASNILSLKNPDSDSCRTCRAAKIQLANLESAAKTLDSLKKPAKDSLKSNRARQLIVQQKIAAYSAACKVNPYQDQNTKLLGWLLTAFAISLGSAFWFDLLNRLIQLRGAGAKPEDSNSNAKKGDKSNPVITPLG